MLTVQLTYCWIMYFQLCFTQVAKVEKIKAKELAMKI